VSPLRHPVGTPAGPRRGPTGAGGAAGRPGRERRIRRPGEEAVSFYSAGLELRGVLYRPAPPRSGPAPAVVLCHGFTAVKELYLPPFARSLAAAGFAALAFDCRGFGESQGPPGRLIPDEQVEDVRQALTFLESRPDVDGRRMALFGTSFGGGIAVAAAARDPRARAVVSSVGVSDGERWLRGMRPYWEWVEFRRRVEQDRRARVLRGTSEWVERDTIAPPDPAAAAAHRAAGRLVPGRRVRLPLESADAIMEFKPESLVDRLSPRPLLVVVAGEDRRVPPEEGYRLFERAGEPKRLVELPGAGHHDVYESPVRDRLLDVVREWLTLHLTRPAGTGRPRRGPGGGR